MIHTCAVCKEPTYDADPLELETADKRRVRVWLCSPACAWQAGIQVACLLMPPSGSELAAGGVPTLEQLRHLFDADGLEVWL
jgi:hypothetical protein